MALFSFLGEMACVGFDFAPVGTAKCQGQILQISQNQALFTLLGAAYGGDGRTTFALPDLRGRAPVGAGEGPGLASRSLGEMVGSETNTITVQNLPAHTHPISVTAGRATATATAHASSKNGTSAMPTEGCIWAKDTFDTAKIYNDDEEPDVTLSSDAVDLTLNFDTTSTGRGVSLNNISPRLSLTWLISLVGEYPPRN